MEYALKNASVVQELYNKRVAKRRDEEAAARAKPRERAPSDELGFFEQIPLVLEGPVFKRCLASFFERKVRDPNRESDERAADYFEEIGKPEPRIFEFWKKSAEIAEQLKKERMQKAEELMELFPDDEERFRAGKKWGSEWRERLQEERKKKENEKLESQRLAKEEKRQKIAEAVMAQRATDEASARQAELDQEIKRQQIAQELIDQDAARKAQEQSKKKKSSKKK